MIKLQVALLASAIALLGCSHAGSPKPITATVHRSNVTGVWDWILSSVDDDSNKRIEQEEWHLEQADGQVQGYYIRTIMVVSEDQNPFRCNGQTSFRKRLKFSVQGTLLGTHVLLRETKVDVEPGPCDAFVQALQTYVGSMIGESLTLSWEARRTAGSRMHGQQTLFRRPSTWATTQDEPWPPVAKRTPTVQVSGTWTWQTRGVGPSGDTQTEQEEWHLEQDGEAIKGFYDRIVTTFSESGAPFRCNQ